MPLMANLDITPLPFSWPSPYLLSLSSYLSPSQNTHHHYRSLGGWTFAFKDYWELNITADLDNPLVQQLADIVDPYGTCCRLFIRYLIRVSTVGWLDR